MLFRSDLAATGMAAWMENLAHEVPPAARAAAQQVLATVLDQVLRLLHPFVPFLTETLWTKLRELAPRRGIDAVLPDQEMLVQAQWPAVRADWHDAAAEHQIAAVQQWAAAIREARARYQVAPKDRIVVRIQADGETATTLAAGSALLANMAGCAEIAIDKDQQRTADSATVVIGAAKAYLLGVVDLKKEREKLLAQQQKLGAQIQAKAAKLDNPGFVAKAPPAVIDKERAELAALRQQMAGIEQSLRDTGS